MAHKQVLVDAHVEIDINRTWVDKRDIERFAKRLVEEAEAIKDFVRDHKSMDINDVYVVREYTYRCEHCRDDCMEKPYHPECCEKAIREWATLEQLVEFGYDEVISHGE